jgi:hypothetical protein
LINFALFPWGDNIPLSIIFIINFINTHDLCASKDINNSIFLILFVSYNDSEEPCYSLKHEINKINVILFIQNCDTWIGTQALVIFLLFFHAKDHSKPFFQLYPHKRLW